MKVLNLVTTRSPFFEQQVEVLEGMGVESTTVSVPGSRDPEADDGRSPVDYARLYRRVVAAKPWNYDVVHANYGLTAPAALSVPGPPVVLSLWGSDVFGRFGRVSRVSALLADAVVVMSPEMAEAVDADSYVVPHGIDFDLFAPRETTAARAEIGWDDEPYQVLFPYSPARTEKNFPRAEQVVETVDDRLDADVQIQVVTGVAHDRMPTYMNAADALILTSTHEGSPNAVREALACNLPVVSADVGDVSERVADTSLSTVGQTDADLADALERALTSDTELDGRDAVREESLERMGRRLLRVYRTVTTDEPPTAAAGTGSGTGTDGETGTRSDSGSGSLTGSGPGSLGTDPESGD